MYPIHELWREGTGLGLEAETQETSADSLAPRTSPSDFPGLCLLVGNMGPRTPNTRSVLGRMKGDNRDASPEVGSLLLWVELCPPRQ